MNFIYPIVDFTDQTDQLEYTKRLLLAGVELIQLRAKNYSEHQLLGVTLQTIEIKNEINPNCKIIINDNIEVALQANADGVHLGQQDRDPAAARITLGKNAIIGLSTHNLEQVKLAPVSALSYLALGPIFNSKTKSGHAPEVGLKKLTEVKNQINLPLVAIGGISTANAKDVYRAGADCIASISDFAQAKDIKQLIAQYKLALN